MTLLISKLNIPLINRRWEGEGEGEGERGIGEMRVNRQGGRGGGRTFSLILRAAFCWICLSNKKRNLNEYQYAAHHTYVRGYFSFLLFVLYLYILCCMFYVLFLFLFLSILYLVYLSHLQ